MAIISHKKDLAKFGYKTNKEVKNLEPNYVLGNYGDFKISCNSSICFRKKNKKENEQNKKARNLRKFCKMSRAFVLGGIV